MENKLVFDGNQGIASPAGDIINIIGDGLNLMTVCKGNTVLLTAGDNPTVKTMSAQKYTLPKTTLMGEQGSLYVDNKIFMHTFSTGNPSVYLGMDAGNVTLPSQSNVGIGHKVLSQANGANFNVAISSCHSLVNGSMNTCIGSDALKHLKNGSGNTVIGGVAGFNLDAAHFNTLIGVNSGLNYSSAESFNIILGCTAGLADESFVVRIGNDGSVPGIPASSRAFIQGISGNVVQNAMPVYIDTKTGQLGTNGGLSVVKTNIKSISSASEMIYKLNPVSFNFKDMPDDNAHYGLLAEEVFKVMPELVICDAQNKPAEVKYMEMISLLLNEVQKLNKQILDLKGLPARIKALENK